MVTRLGPWRLSLRRPMAGRALRDSDGRMTELRAPASSVLVVCGKPEFDREDRKQQTVTNPRVIVEVLSPSTANYDRGEKLTHYQQIDSLEELVLVRRDEQRVDVFRRTVEG
jgi:Uma2 family endonuclease